MEREENLSEKLYKIGKEYEDKAKEFLSKQGYIIFDDEQIKKRFIETGKNLQFNKLYKDIKNINKIKQMMEEVKKDYFLTMDLEYEKDKFETFALNQIKVFEELGCVLSEKERTYLKENNILHIGDIRTKRISDNKLCCFEVKSSENEYYQGRKEQFFSCLKAKRFDIGTFFILINHSKGSETIEVVDVADLWYNYHINTETFNIRGNLNIVKRSKIVQKMKDYYSNIFVRFEIIKCLKHRELAFLNPKEDCNHRALRYLLAFNLDYLDKHLERFDFYKNLNNLYHSVALLKDVPVFSYNLKERKKSEEYLEFNKNYQNYVVGYNLFLDIDGGNDFELAYQEAKQIKEILEEYKVPFYLLNSSYKGFHFQIPAEYMPDLEIKELMEKISKVIYNIKGIYDLQTLDISVGDIKRLCKMPYSAVTDGSICLPLDDKQFAGFKREMVKMENVLSKIMIKNRGLLMRTHNLSFEQLKENVKKFISEFQ